MKTYTQKQVKKYAMRYIYSLQNLMTRKPLKLDRRYNFNKDVLYFVRKNNISDNEKKRILAIKKARAIVKNIDILSISQNKLYVDYRNNYSSIKYIDDYCIHFYGRNHFTHCEKDTKVISILKKHFTK